MQTFRRTVAVLIFPAIAWLGAACERNVTNNELVGGSSAQIRFEKVPSRATGGGQIDVNGGRGSFGFNAKQHNGTASGHLIYMNHVTGKHLNCTVDALTLPTPTAPTTAKFSGSCSLISDASSFMAEVEDNATPGKGADKFTITYKSNNNMITDGGTLTSGNINIH